MYVHGLRSRECTVWRKILMGENIDELLVVNVFPIKIFHLFSHLRLNYISEAPPRAALFTATQGCHYTCKDHYIYGSQFLSV